VGQDKAIAICIRKVENFPRKSTQGGLYKEVILLTGITGELDMNRRQESRNVT
jgi:hypothetical protein